MKRPILYLLCLFCYTLALGQSADELTKGAAARARMLQAFGGEQAIGQARYFSYTLTRSTASGDTSRTFYTLDLANRYISTRIQTSEGIVIKAIDADGAWQSINGTREQLPLQEQEALQRTFFFNFVPMLQNEQLQYTYLRAGKYKNRDVDIVRVSAPRQQELVLDLFIDQENGQVLTSSREDATGQYPYFADELEYVPVGDGMIFPLVYRIMVSGNVASEGRFSEVKIGK